MSSCVFPGSFDPVTRGHMSLITRAAGLFDRVSVVVMINIRKQGLFSTEERVQLLKKACAGLQNVRVESWQGLLVDYMRLHGENCIIRGVRGVSEFDAEYLSAQANRLLCPGVETLLLPAEEGMNCISSSAVRELASFGADYRPFIPEEVAEDIAAVLETKQPPVF